MSEVWVVTSEDVSDLLVMGARFAESVNLKFDAAIVEQSLLRLIETGVILRTDGGAIGFAIYPSYYSGEIMAQELFWWSEDKQGKQLLDIAELVLSHLNVEKIIMTAFSNEYHERVSKIYEKRGYNHLETNFIKETK